MITASDLTLEPKRELTFKGSERINAMRIDTFVNETTATIYMGTPDGTITVCPPPTTAKRFPYKPDTFSITRKHVLNDQTPYTARTGVENYVSDATYAMMSEEQRQLAKHFCDADISSPNSHWLSNLDTIIPNTALIADSILSIGLDEIRAAGGILYIEAANVVLSTSKELINKYTHPNFFMRSNHLDAKREEASYSQGTVFEFIDPNRVYGSVWYRLGDEPKVIEASKLTIRPAGLYIKTKQCMGEWTETYYPISDIFDANKVGIKFYPTADEARKKAEESLNALATEESKRETELIRAQSRVDQAIYDRVSAERKDASESIKFWATLVTAVVTILSGLIAIFRR